MLQQSAWSLDFCVYMAVCAQKGFLMLMPHNCAATKGCDAGVADGACCACGPCRSCRVLEQAPEGAEAADALAECSTLVELLESRQAALAATLEGAFPELRATVWQSEASVQAAVQVRSATFAVDYGRAGQQHVSPN